MHTGPDCVPALAGTHPALASELKKHEQVAAAHIAQAQRICQLQKTNIENLYECEKKQADDEHKVPFLKPPPAKPLALLFIHAVPIHRRHSSSSIGIG